MTRIYTARDVKESNIDEPSFPSQAQPSDKHLRDLDLSRDEVVQAGLQDLGQAGLTPLGTNLALRQSQPDDLFESDYFDLNHHNISSDLWLNYTCQSLETANDALKTIVEPIICGCGIVGILVSMIVLTRKSMCTSCNCYLTALAVGDLLFLTILLVRTIVEELVNCAFHVSSARVVFFVYSIIFMDVFQYLTVGVTVMLAVERYIAICHPMRARSLCTVNRARTIIVLLAVVAFILRSPKFSELHFTMGKGPSGEKILVVNWAYPYNEKIYTYIVTSE
ncbi:thyrotropin-releasing hormone receptor-like [Elysia marginata]|uniref:Thyrotropin-releasing hormone receptor-like n=1 Tax=Elysia marginata TaxID=1093978 RepID=A0AAV4FTY7_9GAST|nr:thyrotropin-releasing hormone receptor-like [Elysia marginata]